MCGIAGIVSKNTVLTGKERLSAAAGALRHRGPEGEGLWTNEAGTVALGHRRLAIIDLSAAAAQPMHFGGRYTIVYNGELYNYIELKKDLQDKGYSFRSQSDTEVVLAAYAAWGRECLQQFDGAFAFVIWDEQEGVLFAARDRFGEKPFFYHYDEEQLAFASEQKALWATGIPKDVNKSLLYNFLTIGYTINPADPSETFYRNIRKLPAASCLTYSLSKNELVVEKWWQVYVDVNNTITEKEAVETFNDLFSTSIRRRLRSDVGIGTSLSGGLDSSAVVAFCDAEKSEQYRHQCFTASFPGFAKDEQAFATAVARQFNLQHHAVTIQANEVPGLMEQAMRAQEVPFTSASALVQYKVYQTAKAAGVTVVLDGQGADEILAGYHKYYKWWWQELYRQKQLSKSGELEAARALGVQEPFDQKNKAAALLPQFTASILEGKKAREAVRQQGLNHDFAAHYKHQLYYATPHSFDLNGALYYNTFINGLEELLHLADRNSMAHSVEVRLPFLYHPLVEWLFTLPPHFKIHQGWTKWLLRKAVEPRLSTEIVWRKDKVGFEPPQKLWMVNESVLEAIQEAKALLVENDILDESVLLKKVQPHDAHVAENLDWKYWSASVLFNE